MSNLIVWTNNASSLLASAITTGSTTVVVTAGQGALFPAVAAGQYAVGTLEDTSGNIEVVFITGRTTDTMTITRGQEGTAPAAFASGSRFELRVTAGVLATLLQKVGGDTLSGTTNLAGVLALGSGGSIQGGEIAGTAVRGAAGVTGNQILVPSNGSSPPTASSSVILTAANITTNMPSGAGLMISGMVCFWTGASNAIPPGYVLCDGTNSTPDLRDQFIVGGGGALPTTGGANPGVTGSTSLGSLAVGGTALTIDQIPSHNHAYYLSAATFSSNGHPGVIGIDAGGAYVTNLPTYSGSAPANTPFIQTTGGSGGPGTNTAANVHTHTISGSTAHAHTITLPPYRALFAIMKT